ncbi:MAG: bacillithiol biosynthesis BshC [Actinobacteria bacterium]|nr:bacillithiol biosynthesis BshC [Actinomycetota bacterium]
MTSRLGFAQPQQVYPSRLIYQDYLAHSEKLTSFYRCYPANEQVLSARIGELASVGITREKLSQALVEYNREISASPATLRNARSLADPQTLAVVTGQQPGFAGGPLYTLYKAVTAIKLAQHLSRSTGRNVVPVFWIASEDANLREVNRVAWIDRQGRFRKIRANLPHTRRQICTLRTDQAVLTAFNELMDLLPATEFRSPWQQLYQPQENEPWGRWFGRIYAQLFAEYGLILLEPHIVYPHAGEIFGRIFSRFGNLQQTFDSSTAALAEQGYTPQISPKSRVTLYTVRDGQRWPLTSPPADYTPADLSCSVMFRSVVQDFLLPTVAYVAGPGEIAYFAQLTGLYKQLDVPMPVVWPRSSMTLLAPDIARLLAKSTLGDQEFLCESAPDVQDEQLTQNQLQTIRLTLRPHSQPQERVFLLLAYLVYYGQAVLDRIIEQTDIFDFRHRIVYFSEQGCT